VIAFILGIGAPGEHDVDSGVREDGVEPAAEPAVESGVWVSGHEPGSAADVV
jgi:hypothetical protein